MGHDVELVQCPFNNRDPIPAKFKHVTNIKTRKLLCCDHIAMWKAVDANMVETVLADVTKMQNSSMISMDRLIKVDEKTSVSNIIHVSYI